MLLRKAMMMALVAVAVAPGVARAAWQAPVLVPGDYLAGGNPSELAVADDGRAAVGAIQIRPAGLALIAPGGAVTPFDGPRVDQPGGLVFADDGTLVVMGTVSSGEYVADFSSKDPSCCDRPAVLRWPPGGAPALTIVQPTIHANYLMQDFGLDGTGSAVFLALGDPSGYDEPLPARLVAVRVPADGTRPTLRTLPYRPQTDAPYPYALRARTAGAGAFVVLNDDDRRWRSFDIGRGRWRTGPSSAPMVFGSLLIGPRGERMLATLDARHGVLLRVQGRRTRALGPAHRLWGITAGEDGTIAVLTGDRERHLSLRTIDPRGRAAAPRRLGTLRTEAGYPEGVSAGPFLAVDARGHAHVAWHPPGGGAIVAGPHGRRALPGSLQTMATSPGGATAVTLRYDGALHVAVDTP
jgi:hypothetical protein